MKFQQLMLLLHKAKKTAESKGLTMKQIENLDIVDTNILGNIQNIEIHTELVQAQGLYYLLLKKKQ